MTDTQVSFDDHFGHFAPCDKIIRAGKWLIGGAGYAIVIQLLRQALEQNPGEDPLLICQGVLRENREQDTNLILVEKGTVWTMCHLGCMYKIAGRWFAVGHTRSAMAYLEGATEGLQDDIDQAIARRCMAYIARNHMGVSKELVVEELS